MKLKTLFYFFCFCMSALLAQNTDPDETYYLFFRDENKIYLNNLYIPKKREIEIPVKYIVPDIGEMNLLIKILSEDKKGFRFVDQDGFERPQDSVILGEGIKEMIHHKIKYRYYENDKEKLPIIPKKPGQFFVDLYHLQFLFDNRSIDNKDTIKWADFVPQTKNGKLLNLKTKIYEKFESEMLPKFKKHYELQQKLAKLRKEPSRNLHYASGHPIIHVNNFLLPRGENPFETIAIETSNWGHRGWHFGNYYLTFKDGPDYRPIGKYCGKTMEDDLPNKLCHTKWSYKPMKPDQNHTTWINNPLFEGSWISDEHAYKNKTIFFDDDRSPWKDLINYMRGKNSYNVKDCKKENGEETCLKEEIQHYEKSYAFFITELDKVKERYTQGCNNKGWHQGGDRGKCFSLNDALYHAVKNAADNLYKPLFNGVAKQMLDIYKELNEAKLEYELTINDFEYAAALREKSFTANTLDYHRITIQNASENDFQLRPMNNVDIEKNSIIFARESDSKNLLDYLFIPTKTNTAKEIGVKIELKDKENQAIHFEKNTFQFTPSDYGTQAFTGFVEKEFDNGKFQIPLKIQMSRIFFKTADIDVCQNETELLDLSKYLNVPFNPKTMSFTSPDFVILEKNGEKKYINLDQVQPVKDGRVRLLLEDGEIPGSITVKPNIPLPAFDEKPFFVCGQPVLNKRKNKNTEEYLYDLNDLMKGFPANSSFFLDKGNGSFQPIKNGILQTNTDGIQKFQLRSDFTSEWGTCKNNRNIQVELRNSPAQPQITDNILYQELCKGELPTMTFTGWEFKNKLNVYDQKVHYFDPVAVQNFGAQLSDKDFPNTTAIFPKNPTETEHFSLFAYQYDPSTTCLSKPLELKFNPTAFRELPIKSGHPKIQQGEGTVFFVKEDDMKNMENPQFHWTFSNTEFSEVKPIMVAGNFFIQQFLHPGKYHVELHAQFFKKSNPNAQCDLRHTKENFLEVLAIEPTKIPDPILAQTQLKDGNIHVFIDKELVDVYVSLMPMDGQIGWENTFNGYFEFFKDWDYKVRKGIPYMLTIYKGKKPDLNKIIFKLKILSLDGVYTETFKAQHNINPNSEF